MPVPQYATSNPSPFLGINLLNGFLNMLGLQVSTTNQFGLPFSYPMNPFTGINSINNAIPNIGMQAPNAGVAGLTNTINPMMGATTGMNGQVIFDTQLPNIPRSIGSMTGNNNNAGGGTNAANTPIGTPTNAANPTGNLNGQRIAATPLGMPIPIALNALNTLASTAGNAAMNLGRWPNMSGAGSVPNAMQPQPATEAVQGQNRLPIIPNPITAAPGTNVAPIESNLSRLPSTSNPIVSQPPPNSMPAVTAAAEATYPTASTIAPEMTIPPPAPATDEPIAN